MKKNIHPKLSVKTVTCSNGDKFYFLGHEKIEEQITLTISVQNHQAWASKSSSTKSSNKKVLKFQELESQWKTESRLNPDQQKA